MVGEHTRQASASHPPVVVDDVLVRAEVNGAASVEVQARARGAAAAAPDSYEVRLHILT